MKYLKTGILFLLTILIFQCGKVDEKTKKTQEDLKNKIASNEIRYIQSINKYKKSLKPHASDKDNINQKSKYFIKLKLYEYKQKKKSFPKSANELSKFINKVPAEILTGSSRISFIKDEKGGWYIDLKKKEVYVNFEFHSKD